MLNNLKNKKILILGLGREGLSTYQLLRQLFPQQVFTLADQLTLNKLNPEVKKIIKADPKIIQKLGSDYLDSLESYNVIIKTPGIPLSGPLAKKNIADKITSQVKLFFDNCIGKIIAVTGTKGKSTTASLIYHILKNSKTNVFFAGNIGNPVLPLLQKQKNDSLFVLELSSHQLADLNKSPHVAVLLNIYPEHQDYYKNSDQYFQAKANIAKHQHPNDWLVFDAANVQTQSIASQSVAKKISFSITSNDTTIFVKDSFIYHQKEKIIPVSQVPLIGKFNLKNVMAAIGVAKIFDIPNSEIAKAIKTFHSLPHRLELVGTYKGITFYNDSLATNPPATIEAINALTEGGWRVRGDPQTARNGKSTGWGMKRDRTRLIDTLIAGGYDRGRTDFTNLGKTIKKVDIKTLILFPPTGKKIWQAVAKDSIKHFFVDNMEKAVKLAYQNTPQNSICLLSCGSPSFGIFKNYADRGEQFKRYVKKLAIR
jgi:UDP-N-acetylmuramoylalanine--D-glutamate ligase